MDYSKLSEITVKTQEVLDAIPDDFKGKIYIEGGKPFARIYLTKKYYYRVVAWENSSVVARENSSVEARGNSSVEARENSQIVDMLQGAKIKISGNSRIVYMPKNIHEFMDFYGIKHTKTKAKFFKAVHKVADDRFASDYDRCFYYQIGNTYKSLCDPNTEIDCSHGLHIAHLNWALWFGSDWNDIAILEVETKIEDIVLPKSSEGKVRTKQIKVLREVPLEECGVFGKILARRKARSK